MSNLSGTRIRDTFNRLIQINQVGNVGVDSVARNLQDGGGNNLPILVSTTGIVLTGIPSAPTASLNTNTNQLATTSFVINQGYLTSGSPNFSGFTSGSITFISTGGKLAQDNSNFFWDDTNNRLGVGTKTPSSSISVSGNIELLPFSQSSFQPSNSLKLTSWQNGTPLTFSIKQRAPTASVAFLDFINLDGTTVMGYVDNSANWTFGKISVGPGGAQDFQVLPNGINTRILKNSYQGDIFFENANGSSQPTLYLKTSNGNVGFGTTNPLSLLDVTGSFGASIVSKTSTYTATISDYTILGNAVGGAFTINLPAASSCTRRLYNIKKTDASVNAVTIDGNASELIDGALTQSLSLQYSSFTIQSDGTGWWIISKV